MIDLISTFKNYKLKKTQIEKQMEIISENKIIFSEIDSVKFILKNISECKNLILQFDVAKKYFSKLDIIKKLQFQIYWYENFQKYEIKLKLKNISEKVKNYKNKIGHEKDLEKYYNLENLLKNIIKNKNISEKIKALCDFRDKKITKLEHLQSEKEKKVRSISIIAENERRKKVIVANIKACNNELEFLNMYRRCVDKKKGISQSILLQLCKKINTECNRILNEISDFNILVEIDSKMILRIYTLETNTTTPLKIPASMASGYQKFIMDMILRIVLLNDLCGISGNNISNPNILILDEGFGCLDSDNFIEVAKILKKLKQCFSCIMIITHINELKSYADKSIDITRTNQESKINYCGFDAGSKTGSDGIATMLKLKLLDCLDEKRHVIAENRKELNETQEKKRSLTTARKLEKELEKKKKKEDAKAEKELKNTKLNGIMASSEQVKVFIIEEYVNEGKHVFKCKACDAVFGNTPIKLRNHIESVRLRIKHKKYIASLV